MYDRRFLTFFLFWGCFFLPLDAQRKTHKALVQIVLQDPANQRNTFLTNARFRGKNVPLRPRSPSRIRAVIHQRLLPGNYELTWSVQRRENSLEEKNTKKENITVHPEDVWINVLVDGEEITFL